MAVRPARYTSPVPRPFTLLDAVDTPDGRLELRRRGERDFMISLDGRVLMTSRLTRSELAVAELGCAPVRGRPAPRVLIGGLGLGFTLRAALDALPRAARVTVAELNEAVVRWCRGPAAVLTGDALADPRVEVVVSDVADVVRRAAKGPKLDAIVVDLYLGPDDARGGDAHPLYGRAMLRNVADALTPGGVYSVWSEEESPSFARRLASLGFSVTVERPGGGGPRHAVYVARRPAGQGRRA